MNRVRIKNICQIVVLYNQGAKKVIFTACHLPSLGYTLPKPTQSLMADVIISIISLKLLM